MLKEQLRVRRAELGEDDLEFPFNKVIDEFWDYDEEDRAKAVAISHTFLRKKNPAPGD